MAIVFFSYSHRDEALRDELEIHLALLRREGLIQSWHDRRIDAGDELDGSIDKNLETADIILLLVSPYFIASNYCFDVEMRRAIERHNAGNARVIPVPFWAPEKGGGPNQQSTFWDPGGGWPLRRLAVLPGESQPDTHRAS